MDGVMDMASRWYVIHVYSGFEKKVAQAIREQAEQKGLAERFEQILVPTEEVVEVKRGAKVSSERKFFPGYVLIKMDLDDETWHLVKNTAATNTIRNTINVVCKVSLRVGQVTRASSWRTCWTNSEALVLAISDRITPRTLI